MFYDQDYSRIRARAKQEKAGSASVLPDIDHESLHYTLYSGIDDDLLCSDFLDGILSKMGSFADDWHVEFALEEGEVCVSKPGVECEEDHDFERTQYIVFRLLKCKAGTVVFFCDFWRGYWKHVQMTMKYHGTADTLEHGTHAGMSEAELEATVRHNYERGCRYGRLPSLRFLKDKLYCDQWQFSLDELIALHRGGKYILPGRRVDLSWLQYADSD